MIDAFVSIPCNEITILSVIYCLRNTFFYYVSNIPILIVFNLLLL